MKSRCILSCDIYNCMFYRQNLNKLLVLDVKTLIIMNVHQEISLKLCHKLPLPVSLEE